MRFTDKELNVGALVLILLTAFIGWASLKLVVFVVSLSSVIIG